MSSKFNISTIGRYLGFQHIYYECLALGDGLAHVLHHGWRNIIIEYDSELVIDAVNKKCSALWSIL
ncbi:unnamed protein product [Prunus brigantina]